MKLAYSGRKGGLEQGSWRRRVVDMGLWPETSV